MSNQQTEQIIEQLPGEERGMPSVNETGPSTARRGAVVIFFLLILCIFAALGYWKYQKDKDKATETSIQKDIQITNSVPNRTFIEPPSAPSAPSQQSAPALPGSPAIEGRSSTHVSTVSAPPVPSPGVSDKIAPPLDKSGSSLMAVASSTTTPSAGLAFNNTQPTEGNMSGSDGMAEMLTATKTTMRKAEMLGDRNFILAMGSFIDCALQTRLDSTVPGMTACVITRNIYSDNGKVLLIERGSTVTGEYKSNMRQGMARIFVLWTRIKTPNGVTIELDSPGTDPLGGSGVPGYIDTHFWQRFGGALMLSLVDDVARAATANAGNGNNQINFSGAGDAAQNMAAEALKNTINIPPTLYTNQGAQVGIYIARDLDFSSVYDVTAQ